MSTRSSSRWQKRSRRRLAAWLCYVAVGCDDAVASHTQDHGDDQPERQGQVRPSDAGELADAAGLDASEVPYVPVVDAGDAGHPTDPSQPGDPNAPVIQPGGHGSTPITAVTPEPAPDDCSGVQTVGDAPLRRLTRTEYERTVGDVFGVWDNVANGLAVDERIDGPFASNRSSSVAVVQVRQYLAAAEHIASMVNLQAVDRCDASVTSPEDCARQFIAHAGQRAYRRPLSATEQDRYLALYRSEAELEGPEAGLRLVVQTLLQSPHLLYHLELRASADAAVGGVARVPAYALAARLAYFLWSSAPDDTLLAAAEHGDLDSEPGVLREAQRLFAEGRMRGGLESFHSQWLGLNKLDDASRDPRLFPEWKPQLLAAMRDETKRFTDYVVRDQLGDFGLLLTAGYSFPSGPGLAIRGAPATTPLGAKIALGESWAAGVLTQPGFLAAHAHSNQTSPILRGRAVRERLLCQAMPDPPPDVAAVAPPLAAGLTTRERYALHRTSAGSCFACHRLIDDLGFSLESFDAVGRYRDEEEGKPIDTSGMLTASDVDGAIDGSRALAERLASSEQAQRCYATQWFRYALGRNETKADRCALQKVTDGFVQQAVIRDLLLAIATSDAFVSSRVEE